VVAGYPVPQVYRLIGVVVVSEIFETLKRKETYDKARYVAAPPAHAALNVGHTLLNLCSIILLFHGVFAVCKTRLYIIYGEARIVHKQLLHIRVGGEFG